jgi:hypothetical protein
MELRYVESAAVIAAASSRFATGATTVSKNDFGTSLTPRIDAHATEIVPPVVTTFTLHFRLPLDPIGERAAGAACLLRTFNDNARIHFVVVDTEDFFPLTWLDCICQWRMLTEQSLCVMDDIPELAITARFERLSDVFGKVIRGVDVG